MKSKIQGKSIPSFLHLRKGLAVLSFLITSAILTVMAFTASQMAQKEIEKSAWSAFESNLQTIFYRLQNEHSIKNTWLASMEVENNLLISIEDNGNALSFSGAWTPRTERKKLFRQAQDTALTVYNLDIHTIPSSSLRPDYVKFSIKGDYGEQYLAACARIPIQIPVSLPLVSRRQDNIRYQTDIMASNIQSKLSLTLLRDVQTEKTAIQRLHIFFILSTITGALLLLGFSWWFTGLVVRPMERNVQEQCEFIAVASHELRSPLAVIRASLGAARSSPEQSAQLLGTAENECVRMGRLVDDLLLLANSDAKSLTIRLEPLELDTLLIETVDAFQLLAQRKNQELKLCLPEELLPVVDGDAQRLTQVLSILLDNAVYYVPEHGKIQVSAWTEARKVFIEVLDDGPGISSEKASKIFRRFYRADKAHSDKQHYGLGLSIAAELVTLHQGKITLYPVKKGTGCRFLIELKTSEKHRTNNDFN